MTELWRVTRIIAQRRASPEPRLADTRGCVMPWDSRVSVHLSDGTKRTFSSLSYYQDVTSQQMLMVFRVLETGVLQVGTGLLSVGRTEDGRDVPAAWSHSTAQTVVVAAFADGTWSYAEELVDGES